MKRTLILFAAAALLATGCSLTPPYERPERPTPDTWSAPAGASAEAPDRAAADIPWREYVADPELRSVIELALAENRDLRMAALAVERARALYRIEGAGLYPELGAVASGERYRVPGDLSATGQAYVAEQYEVNLGIAAWELDFFGRIGSLKESALEQFLATRENQAAAQISLVAGVASSYLALAADRESLELARATLESQREAYELIRRSHELGVATRLEVRQAQSRVEAARVETARLAGLVAVDTNALNLLVGAPVPADLLPDSLSDLTGLGDLQPGLPSEVLLERPDILAAEHRLRSANANIGAARAAFFPRISLTAGAGTLSGELDGLFDSDSETWSFAPRVSVPIFTGGALRSGLEAAYVEREMAVAEYEKAIQTAFREVSDALSLRETLAEQTAAQRSLVAALDDTYELSTTRYEAGMDGYLPVLVAQQSLYGARQGLIAVRLADELNRVALFKVLGGGAARRAEPEKPAEAGAAGAEGEAMR